MRYSMLMGVLLAVVLPARLAAQIPVSVTCPTGLRVGGPAGTYTVVVSTPTSGTSATLDSSNPAVVTVPSTMNIPDGLTTFTFLVTPVGVGNADVGVRINGTRLDCAVTVAAAAPAGPTGAPTLSTMGMVIAAALLALTGFFISRRV